MIDPPIGAETPTNLPFCNAGPVLGTKSPRTMPIAIANRIQRAKNLSSKPEFLNAETFVGRNMLFDLLLLGILLVLRKLRSYVVIA